MLFSSIIDLRDTKEFDKSCGISYKTSSDLTKGYNLSEIICLRNPELKSTLYCMQPFPFWESFQSVL